MADVTTWLAQLHAQPWYAAVQQTFANNGVADPLWQATLYNEDNPLDPRIITKEADGTYSVGLFQLKDNGLGAGLTTAQRQNPYTNAATAASAMAKRLSLDNARGTTLDTQLKSIEIAGWNGSLAQNDTRQAQLRAIVDAGGYVIPGTNIHIGNWQTIPGPGTVGANAAQAAGSALGFPSTDQISKWILVGLVGAFCLALIANGIVLLNSGAIASAAKTAAVAA